MAYLVRIQRQRANSTTRGWQVRAYWVIRAQYRRLSSERHPDKGGSHAAMAELNVAYAAALKAVAP